MIADIRIDKPDGSWVLTKITHIIKGRPTHTVHVYQNFPDKTQRCAAGIVLSSEENAKLLLRWILGDSCGAADRNVPQELSDAWHRNHLEEIYG